MLMSNKYVRLCKSVSDYGRLVKPEEVAELIQDEKEYFTSTYYYTDKHLEQFKKNNSVKGIRDVTTDKIWFDFDDKSNPQFALNDAKEVVLRLNTLAKVPNKDIEIYYSGNKGFHVLVTLKRQMTPDMVASIALNKYGKGLKTLDPSLYDATQILRVPGTKHSSGLYKIPLTVKELNTLSIDKIKEKAKSLDNITEEFNWESTDLPEEVFKMPEIIKPKPDKTYNLDKATSRPPQWRSCKWNLLQGNFSAGQRHEALLALAATLRGFGYDKDTTYYMCKSALKKQAVISGTPEFSKEELFKNIIEDSVFNDGWEGGTFTCTKPGFLQTYCNSLGEHKCKANATEGHGIVTLEEMTGPFTKYAVDFDKNVIRMGLPELDNNLILSTSTLNGLLGQPGSGKTSLALNILKNTSLNNVHSTFFSLDMGMPIVYAKLIQKESRLGFKEALTLFKDNPKRAEELSKKIQHDYKNVGFNFRAGITVSDMKDVVREQQQTRGSEVKLVVVDYLECIAGKSSDALANTAMIANELKDLANELNVCVLLLLQTQKHSVPDISDPLLSLKQVKGSSVLEQATSTILTLWRDGYNPKHVKYDKYISMAVVKNRFGPLWNGDFSWEGATGNVRTLFEEERDALASFRQQKIDEKLANAEKSNKSWE